MLAHLRHGYPGPRVVPYTRVTWRMACLLTWAISATERLRLILLWQRTRLAHWA